VTADPPASRIRACPDSSRVRTRYRPGPFALPGLAFSDAGSPSCLDGPAALADHLVMRPEVKAFIAGGPLPGHGASEDEIGRRVRQLEAISAPVTAHEARSLAACFGDDDCYGVAWTLLHLIETGPGGVLTARPGPADGEWHHLLWTRMVNAGLAP
jgi:hypothetical protein